MDFSQTINNFSIALSRPLPGLQAQLKMSSMKRFRELLNPVHPEKATRSGVLLLLYPHNASINTVFIQRPRYGGIHSGQISLPGGKYEVTDPDLQGTALRESQEEIGIIPEQVQIIGQLTDLYIPPSRFLVTPYVGYSVSRPEFIRDPQEVDEILEIDLRDLFSQTSLQIEKIRIGLGIHINVPAFTVDGHVIWGATAMILSEFGEVIRKFL